jgi:hypothetical protein
LLIITPLIHLLLILQYLAHHISLSEEEVSIGVMFGGRGGGGRSLPLAPPNPWGVPRVDPTI